MQKAVTETKPLLGIVCFTDSVIIILGLVYPIWEVGKNNTKSDRIRWEIRILNLHSRLDYTFNQTKYNFNLKLNLAISHLISRIKRLNELRKEASKWQSHKEKKENAIFESKLYSVLWA